jgi:hypothetical protein
MFSKIFQAAAELIPIRRRMVDILRNVRQNVAKPVGQIAYA